MKIPIEPAIGKHRKKPLRIVTLITYVALLLCTLIPIYYFPAFYSTRKLSRRIETLDHVVEHNTLAEPLSQQHAHGLPCSGKHCINPIKDDVLVETTIKSNMHDNDTMWFDDTRPPEDLDILKDIIVASKKPSGRRKGRRKRGGRSRRIEPLTKEPQRKDPQPKEPRKTATITSKRKGDIDVLVSKVSDVEYSCDLFSGEWVSDPDGPYYTNMTCSHIQEHQNCMKFERPNNDFLKWKWKPDGCDLPVFDPHQFLELVRGKSLAFVGDSVARNHMQSLICLLSRVVLPIDLTEASAQNKLWIYPEYDFNISMFWAPYLVKSEKTDPNDVTQPFNLFLDQFDEYWPARVESADYIILSAGHWFFRPTMFYIKKNLVGCLYCRDPNVRHLNTYFSFR